MNLKEVIVIIIVFLSFIVLTFGTIKTKNNIQKFNENIVYTMFIGFSMIFLLILYLYY